MGKIVYINLHWRRSALNNAGALQSGDGEFRGIFTPFYTINFRGGLKSGGAHATVASPSLAPLIIHIGVPLFLPRPEAVLILAPTLFSLVWRQC